MESAEKTRTAMAWPVAVLFSFSSRTPVRSSIEARLIRFHISRSWNREETGLFVMDMVL